MHYSKQHGWFEFNTEGKRVTLLERHELFPATNKCPHCFNYKFNKVFPVTNRRTGIVHQYEDCKYCFYGFERFIQSNNIVEYAIAPTEHFNIPVNERSILTDLTFKKAFEHYLSGKLLINNPLSIEQGVINFAECMEKIIKAIGLSLNLNLPAIHNSELLYQKVIFHAPFLNFFNVKLLKHLSHAYEVLRYKEQKMKINQSFVINATGIEVEVDFIISSLRGIFFSHEINNQDGFIAKDVWTEVNSLNLFNPTLSFLKKIKFKKHLLEHTLWIRENHYFDDPTVNRRFHVERNYQVRRQQIDFFFKMQDIQPTSLTVMQRIHEFPVDNYIHYKNFVNNRAYISVT